MLYLSRKECSSVVKVFIQPTKVLLSRFIPQCHQLEESQMEIDVKTHTHTCFASIQGNFVCSPRSPDTLVSRALEITQPDPSLQGMGGLVKHIHLWGRKFKRFFMTSARTKADGKEDS